MSTPIEIARWCLNSLRHGVDTQSVSISAGLRLLREVDVERGWSCSGYGVWVSSEAGPGEAIENWCSAVEEQAKQAAS